MPHKEDSSARVNTRKKSLKGNMVPWILLTVISLGFLVGNIFPNFMTWTKSRAAIAKFETELPQLQASLSDMEQKFNETKNKFEEEALPYLARERQLFPKRIQVGKIAKILELYALGLEVLDTPSYDSVFELNSISFGKRQGEKGKKYTFVDAKLKFRTDEKNLKDFVLFLQSGKISDRFAAAKGKTIDISDFKFLKKELLPISHIQSVTIAKEKNKGDVPQNILNAQIEVRFFSQLVR